MPEQAAAKAAVEALGDQCSLVLSGILSVSSEAILTADRGMRITTFSPGAEIMFGYAAQDIIGRPLDLLIPERFRVRHGDHVRRFAEGPRSSSLMQNRNAILGLRRSGEEFPIEASVSRVQSAEGLFFTAIIRDVTERKLHEDRLARSEKRLQMATTNSDLHVFELDYEARTLTKTGAENTFFDRELTFEDIAADPLAWVHPADRADMLLRWRENEGSGLLRAECRMRREDGGEVWASISAQLIRTPAGAPLRLVGALQNITARKAAEAATVEALKTAEAANQAKSAFLATVSHEIRTPLNGVLGMAQAIGFDELSDAQRKRLDVLYQSGRGLLSILNDVLDLSKIEAGKLELEVVDFELEPLLVSAEASFMAVAAQKAVALQVDASAAQGRYRGDPTRIRQVLFNLVSNALKFTEQGHIHMTARHDGRCLAVEVADTGIGIPAESLVEIFDPFTQADVSITRRFGGTGLGLTICQRLASLMNGDISVVSTPGKGSTFTFRLPLQRLDRAVVPAKVSTAEEGYVGDATGDLRILAAEDNSTNQLVLRTLLAQAGLDVVIVSNGQEAIQAWELDAFDIVLMDVQMPVMDGVSAARAIRQAERLQGRSRTPIIALTANAMAHQVADYVAAGMDCAVTKPIDVGELFDAISRCLGEDESRPAKAS